MADTPDFDPTGMTIQQLQAAGHDVQAAPTPPPQQDFDPTGMTLDQLQKQGADVKDQNEFDPTGMNINDLQAQGHSVKAEGPGATFFREAANAAIPTAASVAPMVAGGELGFEAGLGVAPFLGPAAPIAPAVGAFIGAGAAGIASSGIVSKAQEKIKDVLGINDTEQRAANAQANPTSALLGQLAPMAVTFKVGDLTDQIASRLVTGAGMAGMDVAQQYTEKGTVDPTEAAISGAAGFALNKPRGFMEPVAAAGAKFGAGLAGAEPKLFPSGRPDMDNPTKEADLDAVTTTHAATPDSKGNAQSYAPPRIPEDRSTIGTPVADNNPYIDGDGGSSGRWAKTPVENTGQLTLHIGDQPMDDPTIRSTVVQETAEDVIAGHNAPGEVVPPEPPPIGEPTQPLGMFPEPDRGASGIPPNARPVQFTPPETTPPDVVARAKAAFSAPEAAQKAIEASKAQAPPPTKSWAQQAEEFRQQIPPKAAQPKEIVQKTLDLLKANGKNKMADALDKMPDGNAKDMMAARLHAAEVSQTGNVPKEALQNVRVRNPSHLKNLEVQGWVNPDTGKPYRTRTISQAKLYSKVHDVNKQVFNDPEFQPPATPETSADQVKARAQGMLDKSKELMGANGKLPIEVYSMNALRKPPEWSLLREAKKLVNGTLKPDVDAQGKVVVAPWEKFLANERLHRVAPEDYAAFERSNQAEAEAAKQKTPTVEAAEQTAAASPAEMRSTETVNPEDETLTERAARESREDRVLDKLRSMGYDKVADRLENAPLGDKRDAAFAQVEEQVLKVKPQGMARPRKPLTMPQTDALIKAISDRAASLKADIQAATKSEVPKGTPPKAAEAINASKTARARGNLLQRIFTPETVSPSAKSMAGVIREHGGLTARTIARAYAMMEPWRPIVNKASEADRIDFMKAVDTGAKTTPELQGLADKMKGAFKNVRTLLEALPQMAKQKFVEEYFPHMFDNPKAAKEFVANYFMKQGSTASLHERTMPTIQDALDAGLKLATTDPIEITMRYLGSMHSYIESQHILNQMKDLGITRSFPKQSVGASGHPEGRAIEPGYTELKGRAAFGEPLYAPDDVARVYNNYISTGFHANPEAGQLFDTAQHAVNGVTSLELGMSAYHVFTMAKEAIISEFARGISQMAGGQYGKGLGIIAKSASAPVTTALRGREPVQVYLGQKQGSPELENIVDKMTRSGGRLIGKSQDPTYKYSAMGSFWTAWKRGALQQQLADVRTRIAQAGEGKSNTLAGVAAQTGQIGKEFFRLVGRSMETVAQPLFEKYIPSLKNGAFRDQLGDWIAAHPNSTDAEQLAMARKIGDSIDNRFGEMVHDNIFWNKAMKQLGQISMRSFSWNLGTIREIGGGAIGAFQHPEKLNINHPDYDPRAAYAVTMPMVVALTSMAYQYLKTGQGPGDLRDLVVPKTGGTASIGGPERASLPGYEKDVYGWFHDPTREALNKIATAPRLVWETISNQDYKGQPIANPNAPFPKRMEEYAGHVLGSMGPISIKQVAQGQARGSNISLPERVTAIREAPTWMENPTRINMAIRKNAAKAWKVKEKTDIRQAGRYQ